MPGAGTKLAETKVPIHIKTEREKRIYQRIRDWDRKSGPWFFLGYLAPSGERDGGCIVRAPDAECAILIARLQGLEPYDGAPVLPEIRAGDTGERHPDKIWRYLPQVVLEQAIKLDEPD